MDKLEEFKKTLEQELDILTRSIVFNRNPISIEFHKSDFFTKMVNEFLRLEGIPSNTINPDVSKKELEEVARVIRRYSRRKRTYKRKKVILTEL